MAAFSAALAAGGIGAGLLAVLLGHWDLRLLFAADAATCLACALLIQLALPRDRAPTRTVASGRGGSGDGIRPLRDRALVSILATGTGYALINQQTVMTLPLALARQGRPATEAGLLFTAAAVTTVLAQPLVRLRRFAALTTPGALALAHVLLAVGLTGYALTRSLPALLAAAAIGSVGDLIVVGRAYALVADLARPARAAATSPSSAPAGVSRPRWRHCSAPSCWPPPGPRRCGRPWRPPACCWPRCICG